MVQTPNDVAEQMVHGQVEDGAGSHLVREGNVLIGRTPGVLLDGGPVVDHPGLGELLVGAELVFDEAGVALALRADVGASSLKRINKSLNLKNRVFRHLQKCQKISRGTRQKIIISKVWLFFKQNNSTEKLFFRRNHVRSIHTSVKVSFQRNCIRSRIITYLLGASPACGGPCAA